MALGTLIQAGLGFAQTVGGLFMKNPKLPEYQVSSEAKSNLEEAYQRKNLGLESGVSDYLTQQSDRSGASAIASSTSRKGGLGLIATVAQQRAENTANISMMEQQARSENLNRLYQARSAMSAEKEKQFDVKYGNVISKRESRNQMLGAGLQNIAGAAGTMELADSLSGKTTTLKDLFSGLRKKSADTTQSK